MKALAKDDLLMAMQLGDEYLKLKPTGKEVGETELLSGSLRKAWKEKVKEYFKLASVESSVRTDTRVPLLTYHVFSKMDSFVDLKCRVWVQLNNDTLCSAEFNYFTVRKSNQHIDTVETRSASEKIKRWRIVLEYHDAVAAEKESEPAGPIGWWKGEATKLISWAKEADSKKEAPDAYFSRTLGKRVIDTEADNSDP